MRTKTSIVLLILSICAFSATDSLRYTGKYYEGAIEKRFDIGEGGKLTMEEITGDVSVTGEARSDIYIKEEYKIHTYSKSEAKKLLSKNRAKFMRKGNAINVEGRDYSKRYRARFEVKVPRVFDVNISTSGGDLVIQSFKGDIKVGTSGGDVDLLNLSGGIEGRTSGGDICVRECKGNLRVSTSGGDVDVKDQKGDIYASTSGGDIEIKGVKGDGEVRTSGGDIVISDVVGSRFEAHTSGGDVEANNVDASVVLGTSGGDIIVGNVKKDIEMHTSGGDIEIEFVRDNLDAHTSGGDIYVGEVNGDTKLRTSGGDIEVEIAYNNLDVNTSGGDIEVGSVAGAVRAHTSGGDIEVEKVLRKGIEDNSIRISTSGGDILVCIPDDIQADVDATIKLSRRWAREKEISSEFPLKITKSEKGSRITIRGTGTINGGGNLIKLETSDGDIIIKKVLGK